MNDSQLDSLRTVSWVSYLLHLIVAVGAVFPGAQASLASGCGLPQLNWARRPALRFCWWR